jgi:hypothetical protein
MTDSQKHRAATLSWVNRQRAKYGIGEPLTELPLGHRRMPSRCPVARALAGDGHTASVGRETGTLTDERARIRHYLRLPRQVSLFTADFDEGGHPDLQAAQ